MGKSLEERENEIKMLKQEKIAFKVKEIEINRINRWVKIAKLGTLSDDLTNLKSIVSGIKLWKWRRKIDPMYRRIENWKRRKKKDGVIQTIESWKKRKKRQDNSTRRTA